jgi:four helix bundle protein
LVNQMQDAAVSSMSNIPEGFARQGNREFIQFLYISKSSAAEVQSQLYPPSQKTTPACCNELRRASTAYGRG